MNSLEVLARSDHSYGESFKRLGDCAKTATDIFSRMVNTLRPLIDACDIMITQTMAYPYKRSLYLATHGSPRVRKKNAKRYSRWLKKEGYKYIPRVKEEK